MRKILLFCCLLGLNWATQAQSNRISAISSCRQELLKAFLDNNLAESGLWMDSLSRLASNTQVALAWDERWLLYYWTGSFGNLFEEVAGFDENKRLLESYKNQAPSDSLFEWIDYRMYEDRHLYFESIQNAFLNSEEKAFASLQLEYLLRLNSNETEFAHKIDAFSSKFPESRFKAWLLSIRPVLYKPNDKGFGFSGGVATGSWFGHIDHNFSQPWGVDFDGSYWVNRWNILGRLAFMSAKVKRDIPYDAFTVWPKKESATFLLGGLELGYDVVNNKKARLFPATGFYYKRLAPAEPGEDEDPNPDYYTYFMSSTFGWSISLTADVKIRTQEKSNVETAKGSYHGFRVKIGYQPLHFDKDWDQLRGNFVFFALHYNFFGYTVAK